MFPFSNDNRQNRFGKYVVGSSFTEATVRNEFVIRNAKLSDSE